VSIPFNAPYVSGKEVDCLREVFDNKFFAGNGLFTKRGHRFREERSRVQHVLQTHRCTGGPEVAVLLRMLEPESALVQEQEA
jgi:dTDP-4-amino-4,6-dideoxygalactose transaminase